MAAKVDIQMPGRIRREPVTVSNTIRAPTWSQCARTVNYLLGGTWRSLIPWCRINNGDAGACTIRFKVWPSYQATHRYWMIAATSTDGSESITFTDPSGGTSVLTINNPIVVHIETISSRVDTETTLALTYTAMDSTQLIALACFEVGRPSLALDSNDLGVDTDSIFGGAEIYDSGQGSIGALHESLEEARGLRRTLFQWAAARSFDALEFSSGSPTTLLAYDMPLLDRQLYRNETQVEITVWVYTRSGTGTTGDIVFTMTNGDSVTISVTAADAGTWRSGAVSVDAEDLTADDGRRSTRFDQCTVTGTRTAGSFSVSIDAISIAGRAT